MNKLWLIGVMLLVQSWSIRAQAPSAPGSARGLDSPLEITQVQVLSGHPDFGVTRQRLTLGRAPPPISAIFIGKGGSGLISGHWELATPSDGTPTALDLTPTPLLTPSDRMEQRKFRQLGTFSFSLSPGERRLIEAPAIEAALTTQIGRYHVLLRIDSISSISPVAAILPRRISPVVLEVARARTSN